MKLGTTYICVEDIDESLKFYRQFFGEEPAHANDNRWITFHSGNSLSLYNKKYDERLIHEKDQARFNKAYIDDLTAETGEKKNNIMILNFEVDDLKAEYERIRGLGIGEVSEIMYVNVHHPYWYFNVKDPDGNTLEITGAYEAVDGEVSL